MNSRPFYGDVYGWREQRELQEGDLELTVTVKVPMVWFKHDFQGALKQVKEIASRQAEALTLEGVWKESPEEEN